MSSHNAPGSPGATRNPDFGASEPQRALQLARESLVDIHPGIVLRRDGARRVEPLEGACVELTGWQAAEYREGKADFANLIASEDRARVEACLTAALAAGEVYRVDYRITDRAGAQRWLREIGRGTPRAERPAEMLGVAIDVTRERALEAQLFQAQKLEAVGRLAGGVAHDFNNLLTAILGYSDMLASTLPADSTEHKQAQQVVHAAQRAADLTRKLLAFARKQVAEPRLFDLSDLVLTIDPLLRRLIGEDIELVTLPGHDLGQVEADPGQIEQVLVNLAVNARQAMPSGGKLSIETREAFSGEGQAARQFVQLIVRDTGVGMDAQTRERLFEPFFTTHDEGTGLGLATSRMIVDLAGGHIEVESAPGCGATFTVWLPRSDAERPSAHLRASSQRIGGGSETVLIVEDEPLVRQVAADVLTKLGYVVLTARSGVEAFELLSERGECGVQLLITDVVLPQMSGREVARRVLAQAPTTRVLYVSGYPAKSLPDTGQGQRGTTFLAKPFTPRGLAQAVRNALDAS